MLRDPGVARGLGTAAEDGFHAGEQAEAVGGEGLGLGDAAIFDDLIFVVDVGPDAAVLVDAALGPGSCGFEGAYVCFEPGEIFSCLEVVPGFFLDFDVGGEREHGGVLFAVHAVAADVVFAMAVWLDGGGGAGEVLGVVGHEFELELDHSLDDVEIEFRADGEPALDLELVVDGGVGAGVGAGLERAEDVAAAVGKVGGHGAFDDGGQHGAPVEAGQGVGERLAAG